MKNLNKIAATVLFLWLIAAVSCTTSSKKGFQPSFESLNQADPVPEWFKDAKFGIYFHWGVYSAPAFANEWYPRNMYMEGTVENKHHIVTYGQPENWPYHFFIEGAEDKQGNFVQFAPKLKSEGGKFDPEEWAQLFADAGAKFAGPVAEHHDGFSMWASKANPWNAQDMGPGLDLVGLFTDAIRERDMKVILSMHHAYNITGFYEAVPEMEDPKLRMLYGQQGKDKNEALWLVKHKEIIDTYQPDIIWQDFNLHLISQPVLLEFLSYYYNQANSWNKEVVATYKDGLNQQCAVLDFERGGPVDITENYWLTDDAISSSSWSYTEGIGYYSKKQVMHGFLDRISKNGNLLLNISPKADGTIPEEQKELLLAMGNWLKKYGEAVYATRAWEKYGEGPTKMGADHGVFMAPVAGTNKDIRYTRSKDNTALYAILYGWEKDQKKVVLRTLSSDRINITNLKAIELLSDEKGNTEPLTYNQTLEGLTIELPEKPAEELAYVLKLSFKGNIPALDKYLVLDTARHYALLPGNHMNNPVLGKELNLQADRNAEANQWKLEAKGKGLYKILNRENPGLALSVVETDNGSPKLGLEKNTDGDNQIWKIENTFNALNTITNKAFPQYSLFVNGKPETGSSVAITSNKNQSGWSLREICEEKKKAFSANAIPGTIQAEDFDLGCPGISFYDNDEVNAGGKYRTNQPVDIDTCSAGSYLVGWTNTGEWLEYTVTVRKSAEYQVSFYLATIYDSASLRVDLDGKILVDSLTVPNTAGFQNWQVVQKKVSINSGKHVLRLQVKGGGFNIDKIVFEVL